MDERFLAFVIA